MKTGFIIASTLLHLVTIGAWLQFRRAGGPIQPLAKSERLQFNIGNYLSDESIPPGNRPSSASDKISTSRMTVQRTTRPFKRSGSPRPLSQAHGQSPGNVGGIASYYLNPYESVGAPMSDAERMSESSQAKYDAAATTSAEVKNEVMPMLTEIAQEMRMQYDIPSNIRAYLGGSSASLQIRVRNETEWDIRHIKGEAHLRAIMFEKMRAMIGDPKIYEAFKRNGFPAVKIRT